MILKSGESKKPEEQSFENENKINEMSLVVIQTEKKTDENEIVFLVIPTLDFDNNLSTQLEKTFSFDGKGPLGATLGSVKNSATSKLQAPNKISYVRLGKKDENSDFSKSTLSFRDFKDFSSDSDKTY